MYQEDILYKFKYSKDYFTLISKNKFDKKNAIKYLLIIINPKVTFNIAFITDTLKLLKDLKYEIKCVLFMLDKSNTAIYKIERMKKEYERTQLINKNELMINEIEGRQLMNIPWPMINKLEKRQLLFFEKKKKKNIGYKSRINNKDKNIKKINYNKKHFKNFKKKYR